MALLGLSALTEVSFVVQYLVALIGLGVAIDYSLIIVTRWREERFRGADNDNAVRTAMATAGRPVVFSGITVAVSLTALVAVRCRSCAASGSAACSSRCSASPPP